MGAVLWEQNALPYGGWITVKLTAKDDVDNVGAGRAAKGANPVASTKTRENQAIFTGFLLLIFTNFFNFPFHCLLRIKI